MGRSGAEPAVYAVISNFGGSIAENVRAEIRVSLYPPSASGGADLSRRDEGAMLPLFDGPKRLGSLPAGRSKLVSPGYIVVALPVHEEDTLYVFGAIYYDDTVTHTGKKRNWCFATHQGENELFTEPIPCQ
jgi:hypothetical protein